MIIVLTALAIGVIVAIIAYKDCCSVSQACFTGFLFSVLGSLVGLVLALIISYGITLNPDATEIKTTYKPLCAIQGDSVYVVQTIKDDKIKYYVLVEDEFGYTTEHFSPSNTYIQTTTHTPQLEIHEQHFKSRFLAKMFTEMACSINYTLCIPKNSVSDILSVSSD